MGDHIGSVVHGQVRLVGDGRFNMPVVGLVVFSLDGKGRDPFVPNQGGGDIVVFVGGVVPRQDYDYLYAAGVKGIYGPGTPIPASAKDVLEHIRKAQG